MAQVSGITLDVSDLDRSVAFWCALLGFEERGRHEQYAWLKEVAPGVPLILQEVAEPHTGKNRMHFELVDADPTALIARVIELGGSHVTDVDDAAYSLTVMADPDGNEMCISREQSSHSREAATPTV